MHNGTKSNKLYDAMNKPAKKRNVAHNALPINLMRKLAGVKPYYKDKA
jgi:hypothetical protein